MTHKSNTLFGISILSTLRLPSWPLCSSNRLYQLLSLSNGLLSGLPSWLFKQTILLVMHNVLPPNYCRALMLFFRWLINHWVSITKSNITTINAPAYSIKSNPNPSLISDFLMLWSANINNETDDKICTRRLIRDITQNFSFIFPLSALRPVAAWKITGAKNKNISTKASSFVAVIIAVTGKIDWFMVVAGL